MFNTLEFDFVKTVFISCCYNVFLFVDFCKFWRKEKEIYLVFEQKDAKKILKYLVTCSKSSFLSLVS